jgi:hypothetical protein
VLYSVSSVSVAGLVKKSRSCFIHFCEASRITLASTTVIIIFLMTFGTVETNPGPTPYDGKLHFGFWNLDSLLARNGVKKSFIEGLDSCHHFDIFGICESFLTDKVSDNDLCINGFSPEPFRADCPDNTSHGGVCLYFKEHLPIKERKDLTALDETIVAEINLKRKKIFFVLSYRSPSKSSNPELADYISKLRTTLDNIRKEKHSLIVLAGDFNARSRLFWEEEHAENSAGHKLSEFMLLNGLSELISEPTHLPRDNVSSCIDLIFTDNAFSFVDSGVITSPDPRLKHQIIHAKINFSVPCPPPYKRKIWEYNKANVLGIRDKLANTDWPVLFCNKGVDDMVSVFTDYFLSVMSNNIPNRIITVNDKDAPWVTPEVKTALRKNDRCYKKWKNKGKPLEGRHTVQLVQSETHSIIEAAKQAYIDDLSAKLCNPNSGPNVFWTAFTRLVNTKKLVNIPPLIEGVSSLVTNFQEKANIFNQYFATICRPIENGSVLPPPSYLTDKSYSLFTFTNDDIIKIISKLNAHKAHGVDNVSIAMLKICPAEVSVPLKLIFEKCLYLGKFPSSWKKANVQPVHKKESRQLKSNYRPISLLPICSKIFEKIIFDSMYRYLNDNNLLSKNQSGFRPGDSTINQLLSITNDIYTSFENNAETRAVFLDISKAFDKVWHEGLVYKLKANGFRDNALDILTDFLRNREQRVVINGMESSWEPLKSGVPQGSVLGPLLFLIYINDLTDSISSTIRLFADDSSLFVRVRDINESHSRLMADLETIAAWGKQWKMEFNPDLSKQAIEVIFSHKKKKPVHPDLFFHGIPIKRESSTKHLGLTLDDRLSFREHIEDKIKKANKGIALLKFLSRYTNRSVLDQLYKMYVRPHLDYGDVIYHEQLLNSMILLESVQYQAALVVSGCWQGTSRDKVYQELGWESLKDRRHYRRLVYYYKILNNLTPAYLRDCITDVPVNITKRFSNSFFPYCHKHWNNLSASIKSSVSLSIFKKALLKTVRPIARPCFNLIDNNGLARLTQLRVGFSDLREHRYRHHFNCLSPTCSCGSDVESTRHFLLHCNKYANQRHKFFSQLDSLVPGITSLDPSRLYDILLYSSKDYDDVISCNIVTSTIAFIKDTKRFQKLEAYST